MIQMTKQFDFAERPLGIHVIIESVRDLLYRNHLVRLRIQHRTDTTQINTFNTTRSEIGGKTPNQRDRSREKKNKNQLPDDAVRSTPDRQDRRPVFRRDLEDVTENVVLHVSASVCRNSGEFRVSSCLMSFRHCGISCSSFHFPSSS